MARAIDHPGAWEAARIGGKEAFVHRLGLEHVAVLDELLAKTRDKAADAVTREEFSHPLIDELMATAKHQLLHGLGAVILAGLPIERLSLEDYTRVHWGLGTHLGIGAVQSAKGDRIGTVRNEPGTTRGYTTDVELRPHTDFHEIMSLAAFSRAETGGVSGLVSGLAIHNQIARERPDLLPALYEGFWHLSPGGRLSSGKVPVFSEADGQWSVYYHTLFQRWAAERLGCRSHPCSPRRWICSMRLPRTLRSQ